MEFIGTAEGIIVVGADGKILGANCGALDQLAMTGIAARHTLTTLFGTTVAAVDRPLALALPVPMKHRPTAAVPRQRASTGVRACLRRPARRLRRQGAARRAASGRTGAAAPAAAAPCVSGLQFLADRRRRSRRWSEGAPRHQPRHPDAHPRRDGHRQGCWRAPSTRESNRAKQPFVAVNCASIPESLIEAELFGYEEGAFTGAKRKGAVGKIVQANGGTLFLDEIGDMPLALQARLLRVLQERVVTPLGSHKHIGVDIAVIGATHRNLRRDDRGASSSAKTCTTASTAWC